MIDCRRTQGVYMKPEELYRELKLLAEKLGVGVEEHNFRNAGIHVKSGACTVHGRAMIIIDKHKSLSNRIRILAASLAKFPHEDQYAVPAVREAIDRFSDEE
jgi:hypothetical protein